MSYEYENSYLWDIPRTWNIGSQKLDLRERLTDMPRPGKVDFEKIYDSPYGEKLVTSMKPFILYEDEMDPELLKYYRSIGLEKELFENDEIYTKWSLYTPLRLHEKLCDKKYPLLFVLHGATMPIHWEESSGFLPIAGQEEMIVVAPQNHNSDNLLRILDVVKKKYPVDESRIYCTGYSQGGAKTNEVSILHPEIFAAVAPCGNFMFPYDLDVTEERLENFKKYDLPVSIICGQEESLEIFPTNQDQTPGIPVMGPDRHSMSMGNDPTMEGMNTHKMPSTAMEKIALFRRRLDAMRINDVSVEDCLAAKDSDDEVCRNLGFECKNTSIKEVLGVRHFVADFFNDKGLNTLRIMSAEGQPHWPVATMPELMWDYMKHWRRNPETKEAVFYE